jgi:septum formation protein
VAPSAVARHDERGAARRDAHVPLVLASTSRYRRELLARLDVAFEAVDPGFDERAVESEFAALDDGAFAERLARGKAAAAARQRPDAWVLAADQIATLPGPPRVLLHKPGRREAAIAQLMALAGRTHTLTTAVVLQPPAAATGAALDVERSTQRITLRAFGRGEAESYVDRFAPLDCVGAYRVEDAGITLMAAIEADDVTGIIGLPLLAVARMLRRAGYLPGP